MHTLDANPNFHLHVTQDWSKLDNKLRFVLAVVAGQRKILQP